MNAMTGEEKAGFLLLSLDPRVADAVLTQLRPEAKTRLVGLMQRLEKSPQRQDFAEQVLQEVGTAIDNPPPPLPRAPEPPPPKPPPKAAGPALYQPDDATDLAGEDRPEVDPLVALNEIAANRLLLALDGESPRTIALMMSYLSDQIAGTLFKELKPEIRREVSVFMAASVMPGMKIVHRVAAALLAKERSLPEVAADKNSDGRLKKMADLLWQADRNDRVETLAALQERDAALANQMREMLYQFNDLVRLDSRSIQKVLGQLEAKILAVALKGASEEVKKVVLDNVSKRAREGLMEEMEFLGSLPQDQIQAAKKSIVEAIQQLDQAGELTMLG